MVLRPHSAPSARMLSLSAVVATGPASENSNINPLASDNALDPARWDAIVIHDSASAAGSAATLDQRHRQAGLGELGYHFVVGNGTQSDDGEIEPSPRWRQQRDGAHSGGQHGPWYNQHALGICLVGDGDTASPTSAQLEQLVHLVRDLQRKFDIPAQNVRLSFGSAASPADSAFPMAWFRRQLLQSPPAGTTQR